MSGEAALCLAARWEGAGVLAGRGWDPMGELREEAARAAAGFPLRMQEWTEPYNRQSVTPTLEQDTTASFVR